MTISNYAELKILDAVLNNVSLAVATVHVKLHIADPGEDGATGAAAETDRTAVSFATAAAGQAVSDANVSWTNVSNTEIYSHISLWDNATAGNCLWTGVSRRPSRSRRATRSRSPPAR